MPKSDTADPRPQTRLILMVGASVELAAVAPALGIGDLAAVVLAVPDGDERAQISRIKAFAGPVQSAGAALLVAERHDLVARGGADGAHIADHPLTDALEALKPARIVGAAGLATRHAAMEAGEAGVDYVMFGEPDPDGRVPPLKAVVERVGWWAEVFEPPCIGYAPTLDAVGEIAGAGADFVAVGPAVLDDPQGAAHAMRAALDRLAPAGVAP
jgi:thiamine-phosphate pyrophosphorylase